MSAFTEQLDQLSARDRQIWQFIYDYFDHEGVELLQRGPWDINDILDTIYQALGYEVARRIYLEDKDCE